jgi:hypothetical protein
MAISKTLSEAMAIKLAVDEDGDVSDLPRSLQANMSGQHLVILVDGEKVSRDGGFYLFSKSGIRKGSIVTFSKHHKRRGRFSAYRMIKGTDPGHTTGGMSLSTNKFPVYGAIRVATYNVRADDVLVHWAQGGPLKGGFRHEKELVLKPGARLKPVKVEGGA